MWCIYRIQVGSLLYHRISGFIFDCNAFHTGNTANVATEKQCTGKFDDFLSFFYKES